MCGLDQPEQRLGHALCHARPTARINRPRLEQQRRRNERNLVVLHPNLHRLSARSLLQPLPFCLARTLHLAHSRRLLVVAPLDLRRAHHVCRHFQRRHQHAAAHPTS
eukprot:3896429-Rhodomonas_salina.2